MSNRRIRGGWYLAVSGFLIAGCPEPFPVQDHQILSLSPGQGTPIPDSDPTFQHTLQVKWYGTSCYRIQLGKHVLLTDPFVTYYPALHIVFGEIPSNERLVARKFAELPIPSSIFIGHSHYDHMLDLASALRLPGWDKVGYYGSSTTRNIVCGDQQEGEDLLSRFEETVANRQWQRTNRDPNIEYLAIRSEHAPQIPGIPLYTGTVDSCLAHKPIRATDFRLGAIYNYFFRFSGENDDPAETSTTFTVFFNGAASGRGKGISDDTPVNVDLAILCAPGWRNVAGYPQHIIETLKPRIILLSHYDNFFQRNREIQETLPTTEFDEFLRAVQRSADYVGFERILAPDVDEIVLVDKP